MLTNTMVLKEYHWRGAKSAEQLLTAVYTKILCPFFYGMYQIEDNTFVFPPHCNVGLGHML